MFVGHCGGTRGLTNCQDKQRPKSSVQYAWRGLAEAVFCQPVLLLQFDGGGDHSIVVYTRFKTTNKDEFLVGFATICLLFLPLM